MTAAGYQMTRSDDVLVCLWALVTLLLVGCLMYSAGNAYTVNQTLDRLAVVCVQGSPARLDLSDLAAICRDAIAESGESQ